MKLLESDEMKLKVMRTLSKQGELTLNALRIAIGSVNYTSVRRGCEFLKELGIVQFEEKPAGTRRYIYVSLTRLGKELAEEVLSKS